MPNTDYGELIARLGRQSELDEHGLRQLMAEALSTYGGTTDQTLVTATLTAFQTMVGSTTRGFRMKLMQWLADMADTKRISPYAIFPFVLLDTDEVIVSTAVLRFCVAAIPESDDPISRVRGLCDNMRDAANPGAVIGGVISLGDPRCLEILAEAEKALPNRYLAVAARCATGLPSLGSFQFWLTALEACASFMHRVEDQEKIKYAEERFAILSIGLANLVLMSQVSYFQDVRRNFGFAFKEPLEEPIIRVGVYEISSIGTQFVDRLFSVERLELREPYDFPHVLRLYGIEPQRAASTWSKLSPDTEARHSRVRRGEFPGMGALLSKLPPDEDDPIRPFHSVYLLDKTLPYEMQVENIVGLMKDDLIDYVHATSHYFPSLKELRLFQTERMLLSLDAAVVEQLENSQTWFVADNPDGGGLSKTFMYIQNLSQPPVHWLALKYADAAPNDTGRQAFHLVNIGTLQPREAKLFSVDLFVPPEMFFEGHIPIWSIDIVDAF